MGGEWGTGWDPVVCKVTQRVGMFVMFRFGLNVAGQHFCVVAQLFYTSGARGHVHCKLKLSIKVEACVWVFIVCC